MKPFLEPILSPNVITNGLGVNNFFMTLTFDNCDLLQLTVVGGRRVLFVCFNGLSQHLCCLRTEEEDVL
jgi:hypothetical protein